MFVFNESVFNIYIDRQLAKQAVDYSLWKLQIPENFKSLSVSKQRKWKAKHLSERWKKLYSWVVKVVVKKDVVGMLCSIFLQLENYNIFDRWQQQQRSGGKFVSAPHCYMVGFDEPVEIHEFSSINSIDSVLRKEKIVEGTMQVQHLGQYILSCS